MSKVEIRKALSHELKTVQNLARHTIDKSYRSFLGDEGVDAFINSGESDKVVASNFERCYVLTDDENVRAYCIYSDDLIDIMMVDYEYHRQGFGTQLLSYVETQLFCLGHATIRLETFKGNQLAIKFYLKNDWTIVREEADEEYGFVRVFFEKYVK